MAGQLILTNSRIGSFMACPRRHWWAYELGIRKDSGSLALSMGTAYHNGLEILNRGGTVDRAVAQIMGTSTMDETDRAIAACMVDGWAWRWSNAPAGKVLAVEQVFEYKPVKRARWSSAGKIDAIVELPDGRVAVVEYKTVREDVAPTSDYWRRLLIDRQISGYIMGARSLGYTVDTVLYDVARVPGIRPKLLSRKPVPEGEEAPREDTQAFSERLANDISQRPDWYYARHEIPRMAHDLDEWAKDSAAITESIKTSQKKAHWPRNTDACNRWGKCPYFAPCSESFDPQTAGTPSGYTRVTNVNVELTISGLAAEEVPNDESNG